MPRLTWSWQKAGNGFEVMEGGVPVARRTLDELVAARLALPAKGSFKSLSRLSDAPGELFSTEVLGEMREDRI